jgi:hypothetical protein
LKTAGVLFSVDMGNTGINVITQVETLAPLTAIAITTYIPTITLTA